MKHYLAFVGPSIIHKAFQEMDETWDMQIPMEDLDSFERELSLPDEQARVSKDTSVIIFFSRLYNQNPQKFAELVAFYAPYSVVCVLIPEMDIAQYKSQIEKDVRDAQLREAQLDPNYNTNTPFYFTLYEDAQVEIFSAIEDYVRSSVVDAQIQEAIATMLPDTDIPAIEQFEEIGYEDNSDELSIPSAGGDGKVIAVTSSKGGSGKSTVAIALGAYIAKSSQIAAQTGLTPKPLKVCLVDLDVRDGQLWFLTAAQRPKTIMDIVAMGEPSVSHIEQGIYKSDKLGCDFIFAAKRPRTAKEIPASFYAKMIQNLRAMYDIVILDTSVNYLDPLLEDVAYPIADRIVFVSDMGISSVFGCTRWINETLYSQERGDKNIDPNKVGIVINKALKDINMGPEKLEKATKGIPIVSMIPSAPSLITYAANTGELGQILNQENINKAIRRVAEAVIDEPLAEVPYVR